MKYKMKKRPVSIIEKLELTLLTIMGFFTLIISMLDLFGILNKSSWLVSEIPTLNLALLSFILILLILLKRDVNNKLYAILDKLQE